MKCTLNDIPRLTISCQIRAGQPFSHDDYILRKIIDSVVLAGAKSLRLNGAEHIKYVAKQYPQVFILGIKKVITERSPSSGWVTPDFESAQEILSSNPDVLVIDGGEQLHTRESLEKLIHQVRAVSTIPIGCDIGTESEALRALECGADIVLTTFVQAKTREANTWEQHLDLVRRLVEKDIFVIAEGGIVDERQAASLLLAGARRVVLGRIVNDPGFNTERFLNAMNTDDMLRLSSLFYDYIHERPINMQKLTPHGSARTYVRMVSKNALMLGSTGNDTKENETFVALAHHLHAQGIRVPKIFSYSNDYRYYLQEYCGDKDLFSIVQDSDSDLWGTLLKKAIDLLCDFQEKGTHHWDFSHSYPFPEFDTREIIRDFERFVKKFLENLHVSYSKDSLDAECRKITSLVAEISQTEYVLMQRECQTRNILIQNDECRLIDFQGARRGPLHYDLASLLYQSQLGYTDELRITMIDYYFSKRKVVDKAIFMKNFYVIAVVRLIQSIGSYGVAGLEQKKGYFLRSIPSALGNLRRLLEMLSSVYSVDFPEFRKVVDRSEAGFSKLYDQNL